jgi:hypothetical protein
MSRIEHFITIIESSDFEQVESARDSVSKQDLEALAEAYWSLPTWEQKCSLVHLIQDHLDPRTRDIMLDYLKAPDSSEEHVELTKAIALCHLEGNLDNFMAYYHDRRLIAPAIRRYLRVPSQDDVKEIKALVKRGARKLDVLFYIGAASGILFGPLVLIASFIPAVTTPRHIDGSNLTIMRMFGGGMAILLGWAIAEQYLKWRRDSRLLTLLDENPGEIAWVYKVISTGSIQGTPGGTKRTVARFIHVHFHLLDGSSHKVWLREREADRLIALIEDNFLDVSTGYSADMEEEYKKSPSALKKNPRRTREAKNVASSIRT